MKQTPDLQKWIAFNIKAHSGHNTQPWKFKIEENTIEIHPDFNRALPIVDADNHALYISLGCATENIVIVAKNDGFNATVKLLKDKNNIDFIRVVFAYKTDTNKDDLFNCIAKRQVTRNAYNSTQIDSEHLNQLKETFNFKSVHITFFTSPDTINKLKPFIIEGSNLQFQNKLFVNELVSWIRFSKHEVEAKEDGIWHASMAMPATGRFLGTIIMKQFVSAKSEAKRWNKLINTSAGFVLFSVKKNTAEHWVSLGRTFQRFALTATKLNINHAHVNMPCEELSVRTKMASYLNLENNIPLLLLVFDIQTRCQILLEDQLRTS
jgi:hypothetical protein